MDRLVSHKEKKPDGDSDRLGWINRRFELFQEDEMLGQGCSNLVGNFSFDFTVIIVCIFFYFFFGGGLTSWELRNIFLTS